MYDAFEVFNKQDLGATKKRLEVILETRSEVYVNHSAKLEYPNLFISFDDHEFEALLNKVFMNWGIKSDKIVDKINENGFFMTDGLVSIFRMLCNNIYELTKDLFEYMVYNTDISWFVLFTKEHDDIIKLLEP